MAQVNDAMIDEVIAKHQNAILQIETLGRFTVRKEGELLSSKSWTRDKTLQLFQYLITSRRRHAQHKEQIIERIWDDMASDQDFKVALHGINKGLEPERKSRAEPRFVKRQGSTYQLDMDEISVDIDVIDQLIQCAHDAEEVGLKKRALREALNLYGGSYLPDRIYEDWTAEERENNQVLVLGAYIRLAELELDVDPLETIRLCQKALDIDKTWEEAYRLTIKAFGKKGNRPAAMKTYQTCLKVLDAEYGIEPLPETQQEMQQILNR